LRCVLYGVGTPYVYDVWESLLRLGWEPVALIANAPEAPRPDDLGKVVDELDELWSALPILFPLLTPGYRKRLHEQLAERGYRERVPLIDPTAIVASSAEILPGAMLNAGALLAAKVRVGEQVVVNRSASIGHHTQLDEYATIGPGCVLCGSCRIEQGAFLGGGAVVAPERTVGANSIVGAGAVVVRDVPAHSVVVGNPARVIRSGIAGYNDVGV
jgi:sugar O-acyltransferase (sialic acid O-acetyltransferase NeuD family)